MPQSFLEGRTKHSWEGIQGQIEEQGLKETSFRDCLTWGYWVDNVVLSMWLLALSAPLVLSLAPSLGSPCSVQWLAASILNCICMTLAEPLRRHPYLAPVSKHYLASAIVLGFGGYIWGGSQVRQSLDDLFSNPCSSICPFISSHGCFVFPSKVIFWPSFSLSVIGSVNYLLGSLSFWASICLSVSTYHEYSFVTGLSHSGW